VEGMFVRSHEIAEISQVLSTSLVNNYSCGKFYTNNFHDNREILPLRITGCC